MTEVGAELRDASVAVGGAEAPRSGKTLDLRDRSLYVNRELS